MSSAPQARRWDKEARRRNWNWDLGFGRGRRGWCCRSSFAAYSAQGLFPSSLLVCADSFFSSYTHSSDGGSSPHTSAWWAYPRTSIARVPCYTDLAVYRKGVHLVPCAVQLRNTNHLPYLFPSLIHKPEHVSSLSSPSSAPSSASSRSLHKPTLHSPTTRHTPTPPPSTPAILTPITHHSRAPTTATLIAAQRVEQPEEEDADN